MALPSPRPRPGSRPPLVPSRKRGGQPGNQNARKQGSFSVHRPGPDASLHHQIRDLSYSFRLGHVQPRTVLEQTEPILAKFDRPLDLAAHRFLLKVIRLRMHARNALLPAILKQRALEELAHDPLGWILSAHRFWGIHRDADSFFPVSKKSVRNSPHSADLAPLPPDHPNYATSLTDEQWALLAPLIPPDPCLEHLHGQPPLIIAANRWQFSRYQPGSEFNDLVILQEHDQVASRFPALQSPQGTQNKGRKRGRPRNKISPRALLDAILWKIATGHDWDDLPGDFPPMRLCRKYYRRLFLSGRFYTLLLALHNHLRLEENIDTYALWKSGAFITTPSQAIALDSGVALTNSNCMALLFMQLAREAYSSNQRQNKQNGDRRPLLPVFKGTALRTTAELHSSHPPPSFEPLEISLMGRRAQKAGRTERFIQRTLSEKYQEKQIAGGNKARLPRI